MKNNLIKVCLLYVLFCIVPCEARKKKKAGRIDEINISMEVPTEFGRTHFIVGYPFEQIAKDRLKKQTESVCAETFGLVCEGKIRQVYFAPDDTIQQLLIYLINEEKKSIRLTAYSFTDGDVADALVRAMHRGVAIELIVDPACILDRFGKVRDLQEHAIDVYIYNPNYSKINKNRLITSIMHNKFILFACNLLGKALLWTGSYNFTKSAHQRNQENVIVLDDEVVIAKYGEQFEVIKTRTHPLKNKKQHAIAHKPSRKGTIFDEPKAYA
jgi:phosphatidylserine/phosphatidylglycerophosphate/cardiolipin synthase-like enzyme